VIKNFSDIYEILSLFGHISKTFLSSKLLFYGAPGMARNAVYGTGCAQIKTLWSNNYFWRTYDQQEIDWVEDRDGQLYGYEIKWREAATSAPPAMFDPILFHK